MRFHSLTQILAMSVEAASFAARGNALSVHRHVQVFNKSEMRSERRILLGQKDENETVVGVLTKNDTSRANVSSSETFAQDAMCRGSNDISLYTIHIPKAGGMSLACTFIDSIDNFQKCPNVKAADGKNITLQGVQHENYQEIIEKHLKCESLIYER